MTVLKLWLDGQPPRKSNSRRVVSHGGKVRVIKSQKALTWVASALAQIPAGAKQNLGTAAHPLYIHMDVYYKTRRPDLSGELVLDTLQKAGVISDDRHVYQLHLTKHFSKDSPGVSIDISYDQRTDFT